MPAAAAFVTLHSHRFGKVNLGHRLAQHLLQCTRSSSPPVCPPLHQQRHAPPQVHIMPPVAQGGPAALPRGKASAPAMCGQHSLHMAAKAVLAQAGGSPRPAPTSHHPRCQSQCPGRCSLPACPAGPSSNRRAHAPWTCSQHYLPSVREAPSNRCPALYVHLG